MTVGLRATIHADMTEALRRRGDSKDAALALATLRVLFAEIRNREIEVGHELDDDEVIGVVAREAKRRKEASAEYAKAGRDDLADKESAEAAVLATYLPEQLTAAELETLIDQALAETGVADPKGTGQVMGWLAPRLKGRADMKAVSRMVSDRLAGER